jgi:hypothetical protein
MSSCAAVSLLVTHLSSSVGKDYRGRECLDLYSIVILLYIGAFWEGFNAVQPSYNA